MRSNVAVTRAATLLAAVTLAGPGLAQVPDHLKCYKIKDPVKLAATVNLNSPQFGTETGCTVGVAKLFCVPATKAVVSAVNKATGTPITPLPVAGPDPEDRVCYKLKCPLPFPPGTQVTDQFGTRTVTNFQPSILCTPAVKGTAFCGDGTITGAEDCEGTNLGGATCLSLGFEAGTLACTAGCAYDTSGCSCLPPAAGNFPATGQTTCWDSAGIVIACPGTGHDGDIQAGATLSYTDNGDGTITDNNTGLVWEKQSDDGTIHDKDATYTWADAFAVHVAGLNTANFAGHNDWRVPNVRELQSIVNYGTSFPSVSAAFNTGCAPGCTVLTCSCIVASVYWSSTTWVSNPEFTWSVIFNNGVVFPDSPYAPYRVRAVRGGA